MRGERRTNRRAEGAARFAGVDSRLVGSRSCASRYGGWVRLAHTFDWLAGTYCSVTVRSAMQIVSQWCGKFACTSAALPGTPLICRFSASGA